MIKRDVTFIACVIITLFFAGCVQTEESLSIQNDIITLKNKMRSVQTRLDMTDQAEKNIRRTINELDSAKKNIADIKASIDELSDNDQVVNAKFDELNHKISLLAREIDAIKLRSGRSDDLSLDRVQDNQGIAALNPDDIYKTSYNDYLKGNYDLAISGFQEYVKKFPRTELAGNAQYWVGESFYSLKDYERAVLEFDKIVNNYPESSKISSALLKMSYAYLKLEKNDEAKKLLREVIAKYPLSAEARLAEEKLKSLEKKKN